LPTRLTPARTVGAVPASAPAAASTPEAGPRSRWGRVADRGTGLPRLSTPPSTPSTAGTPSAAAAESTTPWPTRGRSTPSTCCSSACSWPPALGHLHDRGLAHLDVKPGNVVMRDGRPVLIDLGLARPVGGPAGRHRRGSPPWMAPEQVRRQPASPAMDLFALGAVLFELATGTQAFDTADDGPSSAAGPSWPVRHPPPAAGTPRCGPPSTRPSVPCWPRPGRPPGLRRSGAGPAGRGHAGRRRRGGPAVARLGHRAPHRMASLRHGASPAGSTTCVDIAGGSQMPLVRLVARGKTAGRAGTGPGAGPRGGQGGPRAGCARSPGAGLPRGR
jgi:hypothetical protein